MGKRKIKKTTERGITLVALVITIVILIILATTTITLAFGEGGLIQRAEAAKELTDQTTLEEEEQLDEATTKVEDALEDAGLTIIRTDVSEAKTEKKHFDTTTLVYDDFKNIVTIPGGFYIAEDSGTKVEEGIVIEDESGNEFVWIPVGEYNVSESISSTGKLTNNLSRRTFTDEGAEEVAGDEEIIIQSLNGEFHYYGEGDTSLESVLEGVDIQSFKTSATKNGGFYIGRYEAGTETERTSNSTPLTEPLVQENKYSYTRISRDEAIEWSNEMFDGNTYVTSQLMSSYAWDTALNFICQTNEEGYLLSTTTDKNYGNISTFTKHKTGEYQVNGERVDEYSNICDFLGNCPEWTTEIQSHSSSLPYAYRGGNYNADPNTSYSAIRSAGGSSTKTLVLSFRIQLYLKDVEE